MSERTTVRLPKELLMRAKRKAAAEGRTLTSLIEDGLRLLVSEKKATAKERRVMPPVSKATGGPIGALFDGTEKALSWDSFHWYNRGIYTP